MAASMLARLMGKAVSKTGKKESSELAKKGTEIIGRRPEKDMGMVEEVTPKRLSGPDVREADKKGSRYNGALAASAAAHAAAVGAIALSDRNKEDKKEPVKSVSTSRVSENKVTKEDAEPAKETSKAKEANKTKESAQPSTFGAAFKEARSAGKDTFTYEGKKYTTEMAGEKKAAEKSTGVREGRNENIGDDTRERARAFVESKSGPRAVASEDDATMRMAKGGMVMNKGIGASMKPHNVFGSKGKK